jgi:hypothetical protein
MIVESAQMLSTAHRMLDGRMVKRPSKSGKTWVKYYLHPNEHMETNLYKAVHFGHPCTVWTMESNMNYKWHYEHFKALLQEYTYRYNKVHKSSELLPILKKIPVNIPKTSNLTPFKLAMGSNPECMLENPVESYRAFYQTKQKRFKMVWSKRSVPNWFNQLELV